MPSISCSFILGKISLLNNSFNSCHMDIIGLQSGDSRGVYHQFILFPLSKVAASIEVCFGSLSCMNLCPSGYTARINGNNAASGIWMNNGAFIIPSTIQIPVLPLQLIPVHTCTLWDALPWVFSSVALQPFSSNISCETPFEWSIHLSRSRLENYQTDWLWPTADV